MSCYELLAPAKNWTNLDVNSLNAKSSTIDSRVRQEGGHLTPYALWASIGDLNVAGTNLTFAMGTFVGPVNIPSGSCYDGMTTRIVISGVYNTTGANTTTFTIRDLAETYTHASTTVSVGSAAIDATVNVEFNIQIAAVGGPGVGYERSSAVSTIANVQGVTNSTSDNTTFDSTGGVQYYLYIQHSAPGATFLRKLGYATVIF